MVSLSVLVIGLFVFSISSWFSLERLTFLRICPFFSGCPFYWHTFINCARGHSCLTLWGSMGFSSVHGILQARILEWVAISFSRGSSWSRDQTHTSCVFCIGRQIILPIPETKTWSLPCVQCPDLLCQGLPSCLSTVFQSLSYLSFYTLICDVDGWLSLKNNN